MNNHLDLTTSLSGAFVKYPFRDKVPYSTDGLLLEGDAGVNLKLLTDKYAVVPYVYGGLGISKYASVWGAYIPVGVGLQVKISEETFLLTNLQYRLPVSTKPSIACFYSLGIGGSMNKKKNN